MTTLRVATWLLVAPATLAAQTAPDSARRAAIALFHAGSPVRLHTSSGLFAGAFRSASGTQVTIGDISGVREIPLAGVDTVWVQGNHWKKGGLIGLVGLGLPMAVAFTGVCDSGNRCAAGFVAGAVIGGFIGGSIGALVGSTFPKWERRFP
jgi:hypothetical protein